VANQFKNRLVGTIILVVLGVTVLPMLFDGKKKHYEDQLIAIPLISTVDFLEENDVVMPVNQFFPAQQPEEIVAELNAQSPH